MAWWDDLFGWFAPTEGYGDLGALAELLSPATGFAGESYGDIGGATGDLLRGLEGYGDIGAIFEGPGLGLGPNVGIPQPEAYGDIGAAMGDQAVRQAVAAGMRTPIQARPASTFSMKGLGEALGKGLGGLGQGRVPIEGEGITSGFAPLSPVPMASFEAPPMPGLLNIQSITPQTLDLPSGLLNVQPMTPQMLDLPTGLLDVQRSTGGFIPEPISAGPEPVPFRPLVMPPPEPPAPTAPLMGQRPLSGLERLWLER